MFLSASTDRKYYSRDDMIAASDWPLSKDTPTVGDDWLPYMVNDLITSRRAPIFSASDYRIPLPATPRHSPPLRSVDSKQRAKENNVVVTKAAPIAAVPKPEHMSYAAAAVAPTKENVLARKNSSASSTSTGSGGERFLNGMQQLSSSPLDDQKMVGVYANHYYPVMNDFKEPDRPPYNEAPVVNNNVDENNEDEEFRRYALGIFDYYVTCDNYDDMAPCIVGEKWRIEYVMQIWLENIFDKSAEERSKLGDLIGRLVLDQFIPLRSIANGFDKFVEMADENLMELDHPTLWLCLSEIFHSFVIRCCSAGPLTTVLPDFYSVFRETSSKTRELLGSTMSTNHSPMRLKTPTASNNCSNAVVEIPPPSPQISVEDLRCITMELIDRITPQTFDSLSEEFLALEPNITNGELATVVIECMFEKICREPRFCDMCCILCALLMQKQSEKIQSMQLDRNQSFRRRLFVKCQQIFEASKNVDKMKMQKLHEITEVKQDELKMSMIEELEKFVSEQKKIFLGSIKFIAHLCDRKLVPRLIAHACVQYLLTKPNDLDTLSCLCSFLTVVGKMLDEEDDRPENVQAYFDQLKEIFTSRRLPRRVKKEIKKLLDLRNNKWVPLVDPDEDKLFQMRSAECYVCFDVVDHQKFLSCGGPVDHYLCENCIRQMATDASWSKVDKLIACPVCRSETLLPGGNLNKLRTKFFVDVPCERCSKSDDIQKQKWCDTCNVSLCGTCASSEDHSSHQVACWEDYRVPATCLSILKNRREKLKSRITQFCRTLNDALLAFVDENNVASCQSLSTTIENAYGQLPKNFDETTTKDDLSEVEKKLKSTLIILKSHGEYSSVDVDKLVANALYPVNLPSVTEIIHLFMPK